MTTPLRMVLCLVLVLLVSPVEAGQALWSAGASPTLTLSLGDGVVKKAVTVSATSMTLTLKLFLLSDPTVRLTWKSDGVLWVRQTKKIPGAQTTEQVALPPGRTVTLEITTLAGISVASITLQRK